MELKIITTNDSRLGVPQCCISLNDWQENYIGDVKEEITVDIKVEPGNHVLNILHFGKTVHDHVLDSDGNILIDKYFTIEKIALDGMELTIDELREGCFYPVYDNDYVQDCAKKNIEVPNFISPNLYLGHNGIWKLHFGYPIDSWLINKRGPAIKLDNTIFQTSDHKLERGFDFFESAEELQWPLNPKQKMIPINEI